MSHLDDRIMELARRDRALGAEILAEAIRIPADYVDKPVEEGGDPQCGESNHERPRLEYLMRRIREIKAVERDEDVFFDGFGNLVWTVQDREDEIPESQKRVIYYDGHSDTVKALRAQWAKLGGLDPFNGVVDKSKIDRDAVVREIGWLPPDNELDELLFGRGASDQLGGVISQIIATRIMLELKSEGALQGVIVRSYATIAEEDNDGGSCMWMVNNVFRGGAPEMVPDVVILTEPTGDTEKGALGIYRGQRGRMQIEVEVRGRSCHGSMPWEGLNPLEYGAAILKEAADAYNRRENILDNAFLGHGTRTASWAHLDTPSDCAVPERFVFRFDRRLTIGETPEQSCADIENLPAVAAARKAGLTVTVSVPTYDHLTWKGTRPGNAQIYPGWVTPEDHPAIKAAVGTYEGVVSPSIKGDKPLPYAPKAPRVDRWIFSTDGVGYPVKVEDNTINHESKRWVISGAVKHPAMFGFGAGFEQCAHKIGEYTDLRDLERNIAFYARFPSRFIEEG